MDLQQFHQWCNISLHFFIQKAVHLRSLESFPQPCLCIPRSCISILKAFTLLLFKQRIAPNFTSEILESLCPPGQRLIKKLVFQASPKLYITSTLNIDLIFWQTDCIVTVVSIMTYFFHFSSFLVEIHCKLNQKYSIKIQFA